MRTTKLLIAAAATCAAGLLTAHAQSNVYSQNVVGYVSRVIPGGGQFALVANQLNAGNNAYTNVLQGLPVGSSVYRWNGSGFTVATRVVFGNGWSPSSAGAETLNPGEAVFVKLPTASSGYTNVFVGEVVQGTITNSITGVSLVSDVVPVAGQVTQIGLTNVPNGSTLVKWNEATQAYVIYTKIPFGAGWSPSVPSVTVGEGFFIQPQTPFNWVRTFSVQ